MFGSKTKVRAALLGIFALVFMTVGVTTASAQSEAHFPSITAESTGCETVTIYYHGPWIEYSVVYGPASYNLQGTVNGDVRNGNGMGESQIVVTDVIPGTANWSGSMWWEENYGDPGQRSHQYSNQGTVEVEPCPVTTTTTTMTPTTTPPTTVPGSSTTLGQVETDLPNSGGPGFGLMAVLAVLGVSIMGGTALIATRRERG